MIIDIVKHLNDILKKSNSITEKNVEMKEPMFFFIHSIVENSDKLPPLLSLYNEESLSSSY